jgi:transcriptional regulator with XRE-family HTH domain
MDWKESLATELKSARGDYSQAQIAARSKVSDRTIGLIEQKKVATKPRPQTIVRLALATGQNPHRWLAKVGYHMTTQAVDRIRSDVRAIARLERLKEPDVIEREIIEQIEKTIRKKLGDAGELLAQVEPADSLREQLQKYVHDYVSRVLVPIEPAQKLRKDITQYLDTRLHNIEQTVSDLIQRVDRLQQRLSGVQSRQKG